MAVGREGARIETRALERRLKERDAEVAELRAYTTRLESALQEITLGECRCRDVASRALVRSLTHRHIPATISVWSRQSRRAPDRSKTMTSTAPIITGHDAEMAAHAAHEARTTHAWRAELADRLERLEAMTYEEVVSSYDPTQDMFVRDFGAQPDTPAMLLDAHRQMIRRLRDCVR